VDYLKEAAERTTDEFACKKSDSGDSGVPSLFERAKLGHAVLVGPTFVSCVTKGHSRKNI
jgi:hypothetical protein